jgi:hypothetical protein
MSTMTSLNEQCPACRVFEQLVSLDLQTFAQFSACSVCGATTNSEGDDYAPDTFFQAHGYFAYKLDKLSMPSDPKEAEEWLCAAEKDDGITFTHAVIIDIDGKITWLRGSPANFCWKEEDITISGLRNVPKKLTQLETGKHYWYRQVHEKVWRTCYIAGDHDGVQQLVALGLPPLDVIEMGLSFFDFIEIAPPASE